MLEESIRTYANLMKELGLSALEIKEDNRTLRLERNQGIAEPAPAAPAAAPAVTAAPEVRAGSGDIEVISPMVGVFYSSPAENTAPYVRKGSRVKKGDTLCIIEAMKLMNEVVAEQDGVITDVCVNNGDVVEYGTVLFTLGR